MAWSLHSLLNEMIGSQSLCREEAQMDPLEMVDIRRKNHEARSSSRALLISFAVSLALLGAGNLGISVIF
jgi:hypothetical protein